MRLVAVLTRTTYIPTCVAPGPSRGDGSLCSAAAVRSITRHGTCAATSELFARPASTAAVANAATTQITKFAVLGRHS